MINASKAWIEHEANSIEKSANDSLRAWIILGQDAKFGEEMKKVRTLRAAAAEKSIHIRREILRNLGYK